MTGLPPLAASALARVLTEALAAEITPASPAAATVTEAPVARAADPPAPAQATPPPTALARAVQAAVAGQDGLAPLFADLAAALKSARPALAAVAEPVLAHALPVDPPPSAADLRQAVAASGLFLEAALAAGQAPVDGDLKAALLTLAQALEASSEGRPQRTPSAQRPAPPRPGGAMRGQAAAEPSLPADAPEALVASRLLASTRAALDRQTLMQAASTSAGPADGPDAASDTGLAPLWLFEIPLATPLGVAVAPFEIGRDDAGPGDGGAEPVWRARFSLDLAPMGPVLARVALRGGSVRVGLWAETDATRARLAGAQDELVAALAQEGLEPRVHVAPGAPPVAPAAKPGRYADTAA